MTVTRSTDAALVFSAGGAAGYDYSGGGLPGVVRLELAPGAAIEPHEAPFEARFLVVRGACEIRTPEGLATLLEGDCAFSRAGETRGLLNASTTPAVVAVFKAAP